jgi:hypothetical protein
MLPSGIDCAALIDRGRINHVEAAAAEQMHG